MSRRSNNLSFELCFEKDFLELIKLELTSEQNIKNQTIAVALSGGADSTCLAVLLHRLAQKLAFKIVALIVDHKLRPESTAEAVSVQNYMRYTIGIDVHIIAWQHNIAIKRKSRDGGIQAMARDARYNLLHTYCNDHGIKFLCTAHTKNDQAETVMMRLLRGSGIEGLSGIRMKSIWGRHINNITILRPLLNQQRSEIEDFLRSFGIIWVNDPSNYKLQYDRVMIRGLLDQMTNFMSVSARKEVGDLMLSRIAMVAKNAQRSHSFIELSVRKKMQALVLFQDDGSALLNLHDFIDEHEEIQLRILRTVLLGVGGSVNHMRLASLLSALERLHIAYSSNKIKTDLVDNIAIPKARGGHIKFTLANCIITTTKIMGNIFVRIVKEK